MKQFIVGIFILFVCPSGANALDPKTGIFEQ
jgi:hypothetical protein